MKNTVLIVSIFFMTSTSFAKEIKVSVKGMVCAFCAQGITKKFKAQPEIETVDVSLEKKIVTLKTRGTGDLTDVSITKILTDAGYNVEKIERQ